MADAVENRGRRPRAEAAAVPVKARLSPAELARLDRAARVNHQSRSEFIREAIVNTASECLED